MKVGDPVYILILLVYRTYLGKDLKHHLKMFTKKELDTFRETHNNFIDDHLPYMTMIIVKENGEQSKFKCYDQTIHQLLKEDRKQEADELTFQYYTTFIENINLVN